MAATPISSSQMDQLITDAPLMGVIVLHNQTKRFVYAQARIARYEKFVDLVFKTAMEPFPEMIANQQIQTPSDPSLIPLKDLSPNAITHHRVWNYYLGAPREDLLNPTDESHEIVERVLINLPLPYHPYYLTNEQKEITATLIYAIGKMCRCIFPRLKAAQSAYNLHHGFLDYRIDGQLLDSAKREYMIILSKYENIRIDSHEKNK